MTYHGDPIFTALPEPEEIPRLPHPAFGHTPNLTRIYSNDARAQSADHLVDVPREWEPGDALYDRSGNYTRSMFQVLPYEGPMFMSLAWCRTCDVFWAPWIGLHCWVCGVVVRHPEDDGEWAKREREMKERRQEPWGA